MSDKQTGGPAFCTIVHDGMTLLDYFAAKAMQGELATMLAGNEDYSGLALDITDEGLDRLCNHWYRIANAMLKARKA